MSGHSKWAQIRRQKGVNDARRGQLFTKLGREISVAARHGGPDPEANVRLRLAIQRARENNMPMENIERAVKRGTGGAEAAALEEVIYEGYGPRGIALLVTTLTDNRNRTVSEVRSVFTRGGGNLSEAGSVAWLFDSKGLLTVEATGREAEELALLAIDAGAEDVRIDNGLVEVYTDPAQLEPVRRVLEAQKVKVASAELTMLPKSTLPLESKDAEQAVKLVQRLEDLDDVQRVFTNADIPEEVMERLAG